MDMAEFFTEASRVLDDQGLITIVLGKTSNIRSVPFKNGEMIAAIAAEGLSYKIEEWSERSFQNRFGEIIYEDVLTLRNNVRSKENAVEIGRAVGIQALKGSLEYCPPERRDEINAALDFAPKVALSPIL